LCGKAEGGHASGEWAGGCRCDERSLVTIVFAAEFWTNEASLDEAGGFVVEEFGDVLANEFELVLVLLVAFGEESFFDHFELFPAFEAAVVFTLGLFGLLVFGFCFVSPLRFVGHVSRGGVGLFRPWSFEEKLELGGVNFFTFDPVEDLKKSIDLLLKNQDSRSLLFDDSVFFVGCFDGLRQSRSEANLGSFFH
jgi:hypothetical protein